MISDIWDSFLDFWVIFVPWLIGGLLGIASLFAVLFVLAYAMAALGRVVFEGSK